MTKIFLNSVSYELSPAQTLIICTSFFQKFIKFQYSVEKSTYFIDLSHFIHLRMKPFSEKILSKNGKF